MESFWQLEDELCGKLKISDDHQWSMASSKLADITKRKTQRTNNLNLLKGHQETTSFEKHISDDNKISSFILSPFGSNLRQPNDSIEKGINQNTYLGNSMYTKSHCNKEHLLTMKLNGVKTTNIAIQHGAMEVNREISDSNKHVTSSASNGDKRFKALSVTEMLPRNVVLGGYIFVCNNDTMQEDLKRQLFGLPPRYRDSVRAITPGLPLFLYNYTTHQLHGIFEAASFGGSSIDPSAWEDKKCKGGSRFPAQVRIRIRRVCKPLEEDSFRPVLHHYDGPKFRLELSIPETLQLLDLCGQGGL